MSANIPSRLDIKNALIKIKNESGFEGAAADLFISLASTAYYEAILRSILLLRENNQFTAANINSVIAVGMKKLYSAYRGRNRRAILLATSDQIVKIHRGDLLYESDDFNMYAEGMIYQSSKGSSTGIYDEYKAPEDIIVQCGNNNPTGSQYVVIPVIFAKNYYEFEELNRAPSYHTEFITSNLSEDLITLIQTYNESDGSGNEWSNGRLVKLLKNFADFVKQEDEANYLDEPILTPLFDLTIQDYGIRLYTGNSLYSDANITLSIFDFLSVDFLSQETVNLILTDLKMDLAPESILLWTDDMIKNWTGDPNIVEELQRYVPLTNPTDQLRLYYTALRDREDIDTLRYEVDRQLRSLYLLRSYNDLKEVIINFFKNENVLSINIKDIKLEAGSEGSLIVHYITDDGTAIDDAFINDFLAKKSTYFFSKNITFKVATPQEVKLVIELDADSKIDFDNVLSDLNNLYGYKFDVKLSSYMIAAYLNKLSTVNAVVSCNIAPENIDLTDTQEYLVIKYQI